MGDFLSSSLVGCIIYCAFNLTLKSLQCYKTCLSLQFEVTLSFRAQPAYYHLGCHASYSLIGLPFRWLLCVFNKELFCRTYFLYFNRRNIHVMY